MPVESIKVPDLGESKDVEVIELLVEAGQSIKENDSLIVLESDKAAMEIPSPRSGVVKSITVKLGDQVSEGHEILKLEIESAAGDEGAGTADEEKSAQQDKSAEQDKAAQKDKSVQKGKSAGQDKEEQQDKPVEETAAKSKPETQAATAGKADKRAQQSAAIEAIRIPDIGEETDVEVIEVHVKAGDEIAAEDPIVTLESDKAAMDIPSPRAGTVKSVELKVGDKVSAGTVMLQLQIGAGSERGQEPDKQEQGQPAAPEPAGEIETPARAADDADDSRPASDAEQQLQQKQEAFRKEAAAEPASEKVYAGPAVRKLARELGVELSQVQGSGAKGRIQKDDVQDFVKQRLQAPAPAAVAAGAIAALPDIDFSQFGEIEEKPMSKLHKLTAVNMQRNWATVPHVFQMNEADITELEEFRAAQKSVAEKKEIKLTLLPFLLKACARVLEELPQFNVSLHSSGEYLIQKKYIHIGVAVATEAGLVVPVVRDVDRKNIWELGQEVAQLSDKARQRRLGKEDMQGACFTISSLGAIGGTGFTPIVNAPEVGILGVSRTQVKPVYIKGEFVPRKMLPLTLSYDHRAVNGVDGGLFASRLAELLADIRLLLL